MCYMVVVHIIGTIFIKPSEDVKILIKPSEDVTIFILNPLKAELSTLCLVASHNTVAVRAFVGHIL